MFKFKFTSFLLIILFFNIDLLNVDHEIKSKNDYYNSNFLIKDTITSLKPSYNLISDLFYGGGELIDLELTLPPQLNNGQITNGVDINKYQIKRTKVFNKYFFSAARFQGSANLYLSQTNGNVITNGECIFYTRFPSEYIQSLDLTFGFWIDRRQLNGNGIAFRTTNSQDYLFSNANLSIVRSKAYRSNVPTNKWIFEVDKIDGDYSFIKWNPTNGQFSFSFYIFSEGKGNSVPYFDVINPIFLNGIQNIDPNQYYKSEAEEFKSIKIGKKGFIIGDSQHQDRIAHRIISRETGLNLVSLAKGGHSVKYKDINRDKTNYYWFYHTSIREKLILQAKNIDYYILPLSTNDGAGGGVLSEAAIQMVIDNYPYYGDSEIVKKKKLKLFNKMDGKTKELIFGFKQTFAAFVMQLYLINPNAKFIFTSIPISPSHFTGLADKNGNGIWQDGWNSQLARIKVMPQYESISNDSKELADWFCANWVDLKNNVGLTFENAVYFTVDGIHWNEEIKKRIGKCLVDELQNI